MRVFTLLLLLVCCSVRAVDGPVTVQAKSNLVNSVNTAVVPVTNINIDVVFEGLTNRFVAGSNVTIAVTSSNITINASSGGGGSQTPILSDIDCGGFNFSNLSTLFMANGSAFNGDSIVNSSGNSYLSLALDSTFGLYNAELFGSGQDLNLSSINGALDINTGGSTRLTVDNSGMIYTDGANVVIIGASTADSTFASFEVNGDCSASSYWASGTQGASGISVLDADGVTTHAVVGGVVVP